MATSTGKGSKMLCAIASFTIPCLTLPGFRWRSTQRFTKHVEPGLICVKMNESYLTGEPFEIEKMQGSQVISGAINGDSAVYIRSEKLAVDSRFARIMQVMQDAEQRRPSIRWLADKLGAWYTPVALTLAAMAWAFTGQAHRFLAVVVVATRVRYSLPFLWQSLARFPFPRDVA